MKPRTQKTHRLPAFRTSITTGGRYARQLTPREVIAFQDAADFARYGIPAIRNESLGRKLTL